MWRAFQTPESVRFASTVSWESPSVARCWLISVTTCDANDALGAGQLASGAQRAVAPSALDERRGGVADAMTAAAMTAATRTRTAGTRRLCAVGESVKRPLVSTVAPKSYAIRRGKGKVPVVSQQLR